MNEAPLHAYQMIPLAVAGYVLGTGLILSHLLALINNKAFMEFTRKSARNTMLAQITLGIAIIWFFLLIGPENMGIFSKMRVNLSEFESIRWLLQLACPVFFFLLATQVKELLFPRALGMLGLLAVSPFMTAAFLKEPATRIIIPLWGYVVVILCLFWVGKPYLYRDMTHWLTASVKRWNAFCIAGICYGIAVLTCAILFW